MDLKFCEYLDERIHNLAESTKLLEGPDSDVVPKICDVASKLAAECAANQQGDECAAEKMDNLMKQKAPKNKNIPSGRLIFYHCEKMNYKIVMKLFTKMRAMMSAECGLPGQNSRNRRNTDLLLPLLLGGAYDPTSIWYQYFLCKTQDIYCYFFTQGWTQADYGQYYLYDNLLDDSTGLFAGATDSNLATLALLGGLGGGVGGYGQPAPYYGGYAQPAAAPQNRRRRAAYTTKETCEAAEGKWTCFGDDCNCVKRDAKGFQWLQSWISSLFGDDDDDDDEDDEDEDEDDEDEDDEDEDDEDEEDEDEEEEEDEDEEEEDDEE